MDIRIVKGEEAKKLFAEYYENGNILFHTLVGSQAYGTSIPESDKDYKFVYIDSLERILSGRQTDQINISDDYVGFEIGRFLQLLKTANPNILDLVNSPDFAIVSTSDLYKKYLIDNSEKFLTNRIALSFGQYAKSQIDKAQGMNKKIVNPMSAEKKGFFDFCFTTEGQGSIKLKDYLLKNFISYKYCGISAIPHMKNTYNVYLDPAYENLFNSLKEKVYGQMNFLQQLFCSKKRVFSWPEFYKLRLKEEIENITSKSSIYKGIVDKDNVQLVLSSILKNSEPVCTFYGNLEGFQAYCKEYNEYWDWVEKRNPVRYQTNISSGASYDTKNMMHCIRLLRMVVEAYETKKINVYRKKDREDLLEIRAGKRSYEDIMKEATVLSNKVVEYSKQSIFPEKVEDGFIENIELNLRKEFYKLNEKI